MGNPVPYLSRLHGPSHRHQEAKKRSQEKEKTIVKVILKDTVTNRIHETGDDCDDYYWAEGNGSCDCNRSAMMGVDIGEPHGKGICKGRHRFLIVDTDSRKDAVSKMDELLWMNEGYPQGLVLSNLIFYHATKPSPTTAGAA